MIGEPSDVTTRRSRPYRPLMGLLLFLALLYFFLTSIDLMGIAFKSLGKDVAEQVMNATENPFIALLMGILTTAIIQSSSVTTSLTVGLVSAGAISVPNAIPIIMGANIGTTVTATIVSMGHITRREEFRHGFAAAIVHDIFNLMAVIILLPLELCTRFLERSATFLAGLFASTEAIEFQSPIKAIVRPFSTGISDLLSRLVTDQQKLVGVILLILSFVFIFASLFFMVKILRRSFESRIAGVIYAIVNRSPLICMAAGTIVTAIVQSSSITTSTLVPLVACRIILLEHGFPITLGANVGTTITAILASLAGSPAGLIVAFVHLLFNVTGILIIYPARPIRAIPLRLATAIARHVSVRRYLAVVGVLVVFFGLPLSLIWLTGGAGW